MGRMKTTPVDGRAKEGDTEHEEESSDGDDNLNITYDRKGKRKLPPRSPAKAGKKTNSGAEPVDAQAGSKVKTKLPRKGPPLKSKRKPPADESQHGETDPGVSEGEGYDDEVASQKPKRKKVEASATEPDEDECRRQLNLLRQATRRPPAAMTEDIFHTSCKLPRDGLNPHRLRMDKDVKKSDVESLFGEEKGRNGFLLAERLTPALRKEVEELYCQIYQKTVCSAHVGKELAMGWTLQTLQGKGINWAGFAAETNLGQRKSFARRLKTWLTRLAAAVGKTFAQVAHEEVLSKYLDVAVDQKPKIPLYEDGKAEIAQASTKPPPQQAKQASRLSDSRRNERVADVQDLVDFLTAALHKFEAEAEDLQVKADTASDQIRGSRLGIEQVRETMKEMVGEGGSDFFQRLLDGHSKKMTDLTATEEQLRASLDDVTGKVLGTQSRLAALAQHLHELKSGEDGVLFHPHPLPNYSEDVILQEPVDITIHRLRCAACMEGFPFGDLLLCSCKHAYHPWCAAHWFRDTSLCAYSNCGAVHPRWLQSWGFSSFKPTANPHVGNVDVFGTIGKLAAVGGVKKPPAVHELGLSSLGTGGPTLSASGSTLSKCLGMDKYWGGHGLIGGSIEVLPSTPSQGNFEGDGTSNPFDSKCSTVGAPCLKQTETSTPQSMASLLQGRDVGVLVHQSVLEWTEVPPKTVLDEKAVKLDDVTGDASPEAPTTMEAPAMTGDASPEAHTSTAKCIQGSGAADDDDPWDLSVPLVNIQGSVSGKEQSHSPVTAVNSNEGPLSGTQKSDLLVTKDVQGGACQGRGIAQSSSSPIKDTQKHLAPVKDRNRAPRMAGSPTQSYTRTLRPRNPPPVGASAATAVTARGAGSRIPDEGTRAGFSLDLSGGAEAVPIILDECDAQSRSSPLDDCCTYASSPVLHESVNVEALAFACSLHTLSVCSCKEHCSDKVDNICSVDTRGMAYGEDSALTPVYLAEFRRSRTIRNGGLVRCRRNTFCLENRHARCSGHISRLYIRECYGMCACSPECHNRVVQRGVRKQLQVFYVADSKGWGIRTLETLQRGSFVFEYGGEVVTNAELLRRGAGEEHALALDAHWQSELTDGDDVLLSMDASRYSNVARWLNHRCGDANLMDLPVLIEHQVPSFYHVAFFTNQVVEAGEELTWDYGCSFHVEQGIMFPFKCTCGSQECRGSCL